MTLIIKEDTGLTSTSLEIQKHKTLFTITGKMQQNGKVKAAQALPLHNPTTFYYISKGLK